MANLNTDTSIVDFLKSTGKDASFTSRAKLAVDQGIVQSVNQYTGSAQQNTTLLGKLKTATPTTPAAVGNNTDQASNFINGAQATDIATAKTADEPPTRSTTTDLVGAFKEITGKSSILPSSSTPAAPNFEGTFQQLRGQYGVGALETTINDLDAQEQDLRAQLRVSTNAELGKPVALNVIEGRVGEQERNMMERIDFISRQKSRAVQELQTANDAIENIMNFKKLDYDVAKDQYDTEFNNNLKMFDVIRSTAEFSSSESEKVQDNARANLQIIYNSIADGGDVSTVDEATKMKINKLELQAGLPQGFYETIATQKPDAKVLSTTTRETGGVKYADVLYKNPDGSITTQTVRLGSTAGEGGGKLTESELQRSARSEIASQLNNRRGGDGFIAPEDYKKARSAWVTKGFSAKDFDENFAGEYLNPESYGTVGVQLY